MAIQEIHVDTALIPRDIAYVYLRKGDKVSNSIRVFVTENNMRLDLTGATIQFEGLSGGRLHQVKDSTGLRYTAAGLTAGYFDYQFTAGAALNRGKYETAYFSITLNGNRKTTHDINLVILDSIK